MARNLVPIKFRVGLHDKVDNAKGHKIGHAKYPDFNSIDIAIRKGLDWSVYIDQHGVSMHYDKACGHKEEGDTPIGEQWCATCVPADFAEEAVKLPDVEEISEVDFEVFYNEKAHAHELPEHVDIKALEAIKAKEDLSIAVPEKTDAINPDHPARGIRKNHNKVWSDFKSKTGVNII